jgi:hypothetical protein
MKIKDHSKLNEDGFKFWPPFWGAIERKTNREHPNIIQEKFCREAVITNSTELIHRTGVLIDVSHPEFSGERVTGVLIVESKSLARNLARTLENFKGRTVDQLGEAEVNDDLEC